MSSRLRRPVHAIVRSSLFFFVAFFALAPVASGQGIPNQQNTGFPANTLHLGSKVDDVQLNNDNLHLEIPIWSFKGRGADTYYDRLVYDSKSWTPKVYCPVLDKPAVCFVTITYVQPVYLSEQSGPRYQLLATRRSTPCEDTTIVTYYTNFYVQEPDGTKHPFEATVLGQGTIPSLSCPVQMFEKSYASDGSGWYLDFSNDFSKQDQPRLFRKDGTQIALDSGSDINSGQTAWNEVLPSSWDANGNIGDGTGRNLPAGPLGYYDSNGTSHQLTVAYENVAIQTSLCKYFRGAQLCSETSETRSLPHVITLPSGLTYTIEYVQNSYGQPSSITLPTGAILAYTWSGDDSGGPNLLSRSETVNSVTATWTYELSPLPGSLISPSFPDSGNSMHISKVTDPAGNDTTYECSKDPQVESCVFGTVSYFKGLAATGSLLKTVLTNYGPNTGGTVGVMPIRITTTLNDTNQVFKSETDWEFINEPGGNIKVPTGNPLETREYDFGIGTPGPLLRQTDYTYLHNSSSAYLSANILNSPASVHVYDGSGASTAKTVMAYDTTPILTPQDTTAPGHNSSYTSSLTVRGNLTQVSKLVGGGTMLTTQTNSYDIYGNLRSSTDGNGNVTKYSYDDSFASTSNPSCISSAVDTQAFLTKVTNALGQESQRSYYPCTGLLESSRDANDIAAGRHGTSQTYDLINAPLLTTYPDGGTLTRDYNGYALPLTVTSTRTATPSPSIVNTSVYDPLGRTAQTQLNSDPEGVTYVDTTYDALGRVATVSNPHRSTAAATDGITTNSYDALGRIVAVKRQDGDMVQTEYVGNQVTVTDEAGKRRRTHSDGLGRLIEVDEPIKASQDTSATGALHVDGSLQSLRLPGTPATSAAGAIDIGGQEQAVVDTTACEYINGKPTHCPTVWDVGTLSITVNDFTASFGYGKVSTPAGLAAGLANAFNADGASPVSASSAGSTVYLTAKAGGAVTNYAFAASSVTARPDLFSSSSFSTFAPGPTLTGGNDAIPGPTVFDSGSAWLTVGTFTATVNYGAGANDNSSVAGALAQVFNGDSSSPATAAVSGSAVTLTSKIPGKIGNVSATGGSSTAQPQYFSSPSFNVNVSGMSGGSDGSPFATSAITRYSYDALDNLTRVEQWGTSGSCDLNCRVRTFGYDGLSRLLNATNPESGAIQYGYDTNGNVISKTDARGTTINFSPSDSPIDALNRVTKKTYSTGDPAVIYSYDQTAYKDLSITNGIGRRTGMSDASGATAWSYDAVGRTLVEQQTINGVTKSTGYKYDLAGNVINLTYPDGELVAFGYSGAGRSISAKDDALALTFATNATYTPGGELTGVVYGSSGGGGGITETDSYNKRLQPVLISAAIPSQTVFSLNYDFHLGSGNNGNVFQIANNRDDNRTQNFSYDGLNRLQSAWTNGPKWGETFTIDAFGNLTNKGPVAGKNNHESFNADPATVQNQLPGLTYDANGNLTKNDSAYIYDAENRITSSTAGVTYTYNGDGTRVIRSDGTIDWGPGPLSRSDLLGTITRNFIFFGGKRIARRLVPSNAMDYMFSDHLGSVGIMTDAAGKIEGESDYYPFGGEQVISGALTAYKFTGKEHDAESGLDLVGHRYYVSSMGRFMTPDPIMIAKPRLGDPQQWNMYAYVRNNPLRYTDPTGLDFNLQCKGNSDNCRGGQVGTTATDGNGDKTFHATVVTSASLQDPKSGNTGTVTEGGVKITTASGTYTGQFINGTPAATLQGSGVLSPFTFNITGQSSGNLLRGTFQFHGTADQAATYLSSRGAWTYPLDVVNPFHPNSQQYRFTDPNDPAGPSIHLSLPVGIQSALGLGYGVGFEHYPSSPDGEFHVDTHGTTWGHIQDLWDLATQK